MITVEIYREIEGPDAQALADVAGELMDIVFAHRAVRELLGSWPPGAPYGPDTTEARALWVAAVVSYARCFKGGIRTCGAAGSLVSLLRQSDQASHEYFLNLRDKHVAHSVSAFEQAKVGVGLGPAPDFEVIRVAPFESLTILPNRETGEQFERLVQDMQLLLVGRLDELGAVVLKDVQAMTTDNRARLPELTITPALPTTDPKISRPRYRKRSRPKP